MKFSITLTVLLFLNVNKNKNCFHLAARPLQAGSSREFTLTLRPCDQRLMEGSGCLEGALVDE